MKMVWQCDVLGSGCGDGKALVEPCLASGNRAPANRLQSLHVRVPSCHTLGDLGSLVLWLCQAGPSLSSSCCSAGGAWALVVKVMSWSCACSSSQQDRAVSVGRRALLPSGFTLCVKAPCSSRRN